MDNLSTKIGISRYNLIESNQIAKFLMNFGLWSYVDFLLALLLVSITYYTIHNIFKNETKFLLILPFLSGVIRLLVGFTNILIKL